MAEGKRPGGLTALAVLNFVFGGFGALAVLGLTAMLSLAKGMVDVAGETVRESGDAEAISQFNQANEAITSGVGPIYFVILLTVASTALLITSGVGYLGQKRFLGRTLGTAYAAVSILSTVLSIALLSSGFGIGTIIGLVYPVLTLILVNTTFKDDLVN